MFVRSIAYELDPDDRTSEIISTGKIVATETQHYTTPNSTSPAWTAELSGQDTRYITGIQGTLVATQHNSEEPTLDLGNLHGDIIATAKDTETATTPASTINEASDYGIPATEAPPKYSWLGTHEIQTTLPSGVTNMGARSYIPQLGRFLQPDPIPGGSANAYAYVYGDPIDTDDLTGEHAGKGLSAWALNFASEQTHAEVIAYETALREEAERKAREAAEAARAAAGLEASTSPYGSEYDEEGEEEGWEEDSGYESVAYKYGIAPASKEVHDEEGTFYDGSQQSLESSLGIPLCTWGIGTACARDETLLEHVPRGVTKLACTFSAILSIACGGDEVSEAGQYKEGLPAAEVWREPEDRSRADEDDPCACSYGDGDYDPVGDPDDFFMG